MWDFMEMLGHFLLSSKAFHDGRRRNEIPNDSKLADKLRLLKAFGADKNHSERKLPGIYDAVDLGFNYRMSEIHASIGIEQLKTTNLSKAAKV